MNRVSKRRADNRDQRRRSACRNRGIDGSGYDHVRLETDNLLRKCWQPILNALCVAGRHVEVSTVDVAEVPHAIQKVIGKKSGHLGC